MVIMDYRPAEQRDREVIDRLLALSFGRIYAHYARKSLGSLDDTLVATEGERVVGFTNWRIFRVGEEKIGYLFWLAVHPDYRRMGVGKGLVLKAVMSIRAAIGQVDIYAAVEKDNHPSRGLLEKVGFALIDRADVRKR